MLRLGLYLPTWHRTDGSTAAWAEMRAIARAAEDLGVDSLVVADEPGFWECWTLLTAVAEATSRIEVGPLVVCTRYRQPALLASMVAALDEVSGGRLVLGLGSGQGPRDRRWPAYGYDGGSHVGRFGEAVEIVVRLLREGPITFSGRFESVAGPDIGPRGPRPAGPPIWVAGARPRTMDVAARWGDAVNGGDGLTGAASVAALRGSLDEACERVGRDPRAVALTGWSRLAPSMDGRAGRDRSDTISGTPSEVADRLIEIGAAGVEHVTCFIGDEDDRREFPLLTEASLERFAPILAAVQAAG
jgi:alkanesulfonate monooxygenase SsuD/methylene tetrahydromethanopterin reductase-like flavin-dependent oxidoreductase (luciferase family)